MMRRKLVIYTLMLIAGISAGYFIFERIRLIFGTGFLLAMGITVIFMDTNDRTEKLRVEKVRCLFIMMMGLMIFAANYAHYESTVYEADEISITGRILNAEDRGEYLRLTVKDSKTSHRVSVNISKSAYDRADVAYYIGSEASLSGEAREIAEADNPGCFDYRRYMRSQGISFAVKTDEVRIDNENLSAVQHIRRKLIYARERFLSYFDDETAALLRGVIFGDKSEIDENVLREFNINSSGHILAVSGLHIGFLHSLLRMISGRRRTLPISLLIILIMIIYGEMTMWSSSTVRAVIVLCLSILSVNLRRSHDLLSSLAAAAFVILTVRPYMLFNTGFQLSFAAMCSIAFLSKYISAYLGEILGVAVSVHIGTIPLIASSFHRVNTMSILINIPIILLSSFIVPICILCLFICMMINTLPGFCVSFITISFDALKYINHFLAFEGMFSKLSAGLSTSLTALYYVIIFIATSEWMRVNIIRKNHDAIIRTIVLLIVPMVMANICMYDTFARDEIVFVAVGQGDCTHIRCGSEDIIIDGGGSDYVDTGERILMPYLLSQRATDVDIALLTHLHKDHYLGVSELSEIYPVKVVAIPADYRASFEKNINKEIGFNTSRILYLDDTSGIKLSDDVYIEVLWPIAGAGQDIDLNDPNEHNMVYMIHYYDCRIMVTGDLLEDDEIKMVNHYRGSDALQCDILKVAHHGSKTSSSEAFLDAASPKVAVIQVGRRNIYGHPHDQTIRRLSAREIEIYRTDSDGAVGVDINKRSGSISMHTMH